MKDDEVNVRVAAAGTMWHVLTTPLRVDEAMPVLTAAVADDDVDVSRAALTSIAVAMRRWPGRIDRNVLVQLLDQLKRESIRGGVEWALREYLRYGRGSVDRELEVMIERRMR
jgi:hypothetical protein